MSTIQATQTERRVSVSSPLGEDVLLFRHMGGAEGLSSLYAFELELFSENKRIRSDDLLGKGITVEFETPQETTRYFHGLVTSFRQTDVHGRFASYGVTLRPWLWFLTRTAGCRIFQEKKIPEILKQVFRDNGYSDFEDQLTASYRKWEYCVQYRETDFNFVSRLMEQEGIYYYFEHEDGKHTLVLADSYSCHDTVSKYEKVPYYPRDETARRERDHIFGWQVRTEVQPGTYTLDEYDFERPKTDQLVRSQTSEARVGRDSEVFDYPGEYVQKSDGEQYARVRLEELQSQYELVHGEGNACGLAAGALFTLVAPSNHPLEEHGREYLLLSVSHELDSDEYVSGGGGGGEWLYSCTFTAIDSQTPFRPARATPKPIVQGPQTAVVVGPSGEEIHTDKYGRVKVQFHWDREGKNDENSSCWMRVVQGWAGKSWGAIHIPRMGQEVLVDFLEGDPDRPIITGRVYNADQMPPYGLPGSKTQSGWKSHSTKKGGSDNFNELRFEDKKGEEEIYLHAEKNFTRIVENDDTLKVGFEKKDKGDQTVEIYNDRTITLDQGNDSLEIKKGNREVKISQGDRTVKLAAGKSLTQAAKSIELKVGASSIKIEPGKITLKSPQIAIQGDAKVDVKGPMSTVSGDAMLTLKGGLVKIN